MQLLNCIVTALSYKLYNINCNIESNYILSDYILNKFDLNHQAKMPLLFDS